MKGQLKLLGGNKLISPKGLDARPTTALMREALINTIGHKLNNSSWLDLFSGSGVICCEALNAGASNVVAIELNRNNFHICNSNIDFISNVVEGSPQAKAIKSDVIKWLKVGHKRQQEKFIDLIPLNGFDFVYLDPPYKSNFYSETLKYIASGKWIHKDSLVICESSSKLKLAIADDWIIEKERFYGKSKLTFLTPSQGSHFLYDIDSRH